MNKSFKINPSVRTKESIEQVHGEHNDSSSCAKCVHYEQGPNTNRNASSASGSRFKNSRQVFSGLQRAQNGCTYEPTDNKCSGKPSRPTNKEHSLAKRGRQKQDEQKEGVTESLEKPPEKTDKSTIDDKNEEEDDGDNDKAIRDTSDGQSATRDNSELSDLDRIKQELVLRQTDKERPINENGHR
ncbi:unnamed protein product [Mytilus coruscus]|uniref:Uncharacterized protein n=1 Tax=Mytilus coruscus TaxID=42192 RepID=A0A6J8BL42_MYTCO|nr:unnamed protein product [Mytilus coruscus]